MNTSKVAKIAVPAETTSSPKAAPGLKPTKFNVSGTQAVELQADTGQTLTMVRSGPKKGWWSTVVDNTEYVGKTPESTLAIASKHRAPLPEVPRAPVAVRARELPMPMPPNRRELRAYRSETGYVHDRGTTAADVVRYEQDTLGNDLGVSESVIQELEAVPASRVAWVTRSKSVARRYGHPSPFPLPSNARILAEDGDGGFLVLTNPREVDRPPDTVAPHYVNKLQTPEERREKYNFMRSVGVPPASARYLRDTHWANIRRRLPKLFNVSPEQIPAYTGFNPTPVVKLVQMSSDNVCETCGGIIHRGHPAVEERTCKSRYHHYGHSKILVAT